MNLDEFIEENENRLMDLWDTYKYDHYCGELFHHDDVDFFDEDLFTDMCESIMQESHQLSINK